MKNVRIGTSGWQYDHWQGRFYPPGLAKKEMLSYYSQTFSTVEINNTFYQLPSRETVLSWKEKTPKHFLFAVKASRYITHMKNLKQPKDSVSQFLSRVQALDEKLGPILFQLPPGWHKNRKRLRKFVHFLPRNNRYAFEFRHPSWYDKDVISILKNNNLALVVHDHKDGPTPKNISPTTDFVYVRFHGPEGGYRKKYTPDQLKPWLRRIKNRARKRAVFVYFNNDSQAHAIKNARQLKNFIS